MDKKSIIGIVLIFAILVVFSIINQPSKEEIEIAKHRRDSIAQVEAEKEILLKATTGTNG
jgi:YidC/Oxa1 family membrane protein insertase